MRELLLKQHAKNSIRNVALFIELKNTPGSSINWSNEILDFIAEHASLKIDFPLCKNPKLAKRKLSCIVFKNKWVIAFKTTNNTFAVHQIIYGSKLK